MRTAAEKGKQTVLSISLGWIIIAALVELRTMELNASARPIVIAIRWALTIALLGNLYQGRRWARTITCLLGLVAGVFSLVFAFQAYQSAGAPAALRLVLFGALVLLGTGVLAFSPEVSAFISEAEAAPQSEVGQRPA